MLRSILVAVFLFASAFSDLNAQWPARHFPAKQDHEFTYPNVHDPVVAFCDGRYYIFSTGMAVMSSSDMEAWKFEKPVFDATPQWAMDKGFRGMPWESRLTRHSIRIPPTSSGRTRA